LRSHDDKTRAESEGSEGGRAIKRAVYARWPAATQAAAMRRTGIQPFGLLPVDALAPKSRRQARQLRLQREHTDDREAEQRRDAVVHRRPVERRQKLVAALPGLRDARLLHVTEARICSGIRAMSTASA